MKTETFEISTNIIKKKKKDIRKFEDIDDCYIPYEK